MREMKQLNYEIAKELKERISKIVTLIDIRVFGSRARDEENEYSDMDVFFRS
ncbi:MAG: nucleotidyltransferase domain-containing protein [Elusimicrobia bacterium]|nr:nucleotidyltransferase domain-containing protein [Elusimicrobiota bacterium]